MGEEGGVPGSPVPTHLQAQQTRRWSPTKLGQRKLRQAAETRIAAAHVEEKIFYSEHTAYKGSTVPAAFGWSWHSS